MARLLLFLLLFLLRFILWRMFSPPLIFFGLRDIVVVFALRVIGTVSLGQLSCHAWEWYWPW